MSRETKMGRKEIKQRVADGWIRATVLFEIAGNPKKHVEDTLKLYLDNISQDESIITLKEDLEEAINIEDQGVYSTAAEVDYLIYGLDKLTWFAFNFMPASIEVSDPGELTFSDKDFNNWMNDLLAKLHEVNTAHTGLKTEHQALVKNLNAAIRNNIFLAVDAGASAAEEIGKKAGMSAENVKKFLDKMVEEGKLSVKDGRYAKA